jgi:hypothetical protein
MNNTTSCDHRAYTRTPIRGLRIMEKRLLSPCLLTFPPSDMMRQGLMTGVDIVEGIRVTVILMILISSLLARRLISWALQRFIRDNRDYRWAKATSWNALRPFGTSCPSRCRFHRLIVNDDEDAIIFQPMSWRYTKHMMENYIITPSCM